MSNIVDPREIDAGHRVYTPLTLRAYDWFVLGLSNRLLWRCPTSELLHLYQRNIGRRHLDVGVGTGYFLDKVRWSVPKPEITLLDLSTHGLDVASARIARFAPQTVLANTLDPLPTMEPFDSVGLSYLLHCLPGSIEQKAVVFDNLKPAIRRGWRVFGATIVQGPAHRSFAAQVILNLYNRKRIFSNANDTLQALEVELNRRFDHVKVSLTGNVALFEVVV